MWKRHPDLLEIECCEGSLTSGARTIFPGPITVGCCLGHVRTSTLLLSIRFATTRCVLVTLGVTSWRVSNWEHGLQSGFVTGLVAERIGAMTAEFDRTGGTVLLDGVFPWSEFRGWWGVDLVVFASERSRRGWLWGGEQSLLMGADGSRGDGPIFFFLRYKVDWESVSCNLDWTCRRFASIADSTYN